MHPFLRFALLFCPADYRRGYAYSIASDVRARGLHPLAAATDVMCAGIRMHVEFVARDLAYALRTLRGAPLYTAVAILAISLAIGANVAVASVLEGVLFRSLPYPSPQQLVFVSQNPLIESDFSQPNIQDVRAQNRTLSELGASGFDFPETMTGRGRAVSLKGLLVDGYYFAVLGVRPELGRFLDTHDIGSRSVVISDGVWRTYFGADPTVLSRTMVLNGIGYRIVGVALPSIRDPEPSGLVQNQYWLPMDPHSPTASVRGYRIWTGIARLRDGVNATTAQSDLDRIFGTLAHRYPDAFRYVDGAGQTFRTFHGGGLSALVPRIVGPVRPLLWLLYAAVAMVLLLACANLTNLQLMRLAARQGELAVRAALGASRGRVVTQLVTETALLAIAGGTVGLFVGWIALTLFATADSPPIPRWEEVQIDGAVLWYAIGLVGLTTLLSGLVPALIHRRNLAETLKTAGRSDDHGGVKRLRSGLVAVEVALALSLVLSAGLVVQSFSTLTHVDVGFDATDTYVVNFGGLSGLRYQSDAAKLQFERAIRSRLSALPGVTGVSAAWAVPFTGMKVMTAFSLGKEHKPEPDIQTHAVGPAYFSSLRIPLVRGRSFTDSDSPHSQRVVIVNADFARTWFGTLDVVGKQMTSSFIGLPGRIVGVVGDTRSSYADPIVPEYYLPVSQFPNFDRFVVRTDGHSAGFAKAVDTAFASTDPNLASPDVQSFSGLLARDARKAQESVMLFGVLATIALLLALAGIYAVSAYGVAQRTHEFGIRKAIGAGDGTIVRDVLLRALGQSAVGIALGLGLAAAFSRLMVSILFQTSPLDGRIYSAVAVLLLICAALAALIPAVRAMRVQPAVALRYE